jgi:AbrB family looped-hinge helix DNA binding protein
MAGTAIVSSNFQISIPKAIREAQNLRAGQEVAFIPRGKGVLVMPVPEFEALRGRAKGASDRNYRDRPA